MASTVYPPLNSVKRCPKCDVSVPTNGPVPGWERTYIRESDAVRRRCPFCNHYWLEAPQNPEKERSWERTVIHVAKGDTVDITGSDKTKKNGRVLVKVEADDMILIDIFDSDGSLLKGGSLELNIHRPYPMAIHRFPIFEKSEKNNVEFSYLPDEVSAQKKTMLYGRLDLVETLKGMLHKAFQHTLERNMPGDYFSMDFSGFDDLFTKLDREITNTKEELKKCAK